MKLLNLFSAVVVGVFLCSCKNDFPGRDTVTQIGLIHAGGSFSVADIKAAGDFGVGNRFIFLNKKIYDIGLQGDVAEKLQPTSTSFAMITAFKPDLVFSVDTMNYAVFCKAMDWKRPFTNRVYAVKITGHFQSVDVIENREFHDVTGTMVGFVHPPCFTNISDSGYALDFLDDKQKRGGRVTDFTLAQGLIQLDEATKVRLVLPSTAN